MHRVFIYNEFENLPVKVTTALNACLATGFYRSWAWFQAQLEGEREHGAQPMLLVLERSNEVVAVLPVVSASVKLARHVSCRAIRSCTNDFTADYGIMVVAGRAFEREDAVAFVRGIQEHLPWDAFVIRKYVPEDRLTQEFVDALAGQSFTSEHFEDGRTFVSDHGYADFESFVAQRSTKLIKECKRRDKRLRDTFETVEWRWCQPESTVKEAFETFQSIYARSWKPPEGQPDQLWRIYTAAARSGALRVGCLYVGGTPIAARVCFVWHGHLSFFKSAYDEEYKSYGIGDLMNYYSFQSLVTQEQVSSFDFGIGAEKYKAKWAPRAEARMGCVAYRARSMRGLFAGSASLFVRHCRRWFTAAKPESCR